MRQLRSLGYVRLHGGISEAIFLFHFSDRNYQSLSGIRATVRKVGESWEVHTRTHLERSEADCSTHNATLRALKQKFGGYFVSDEGRNRYFRFDGVRRVPCEAGCYLAYRKLESNLDHAEAYLLLRQFNLSAPKEMFPFHPATLSNSLVRVFLATCLEDFLKSSYAALLRYSSNKKKVLEDVRQRLDGDDLVAVSEGRAIEPIVADKLGFSSISKACKHFKNLDEKLDLAGALKKPFRKRKTSLFDSMTAMIEARNEFIHRSHVDVDYDDKRLEADFANVVTVTNRIYSAIVAHHGWTLELAPKRKPIARFRSSADP